MNKKPLIIIFSLISSSLFGMEHPSLSDQEIVCALALTELHQSSSNKELNDSKIIKEKQLHICPFINCGRKYGYLFNLNQHIKKNHTPNNPKKHVCNSTGCNKTFWHKSDLDRHERTHTKEKPYQCGMCPKKFSRTSSQYQHERTYCPNLTQKNKPFFIPINTIH